MLAAKKEMPICRGVLSVLLEHSQLLDLLCAPSAMLVMDGHPKLEQTLAFTVGLANLQIPLPTLAGPVRLDNTQSGEITSVEFAKRLPDSFQDPPGSLLAHSALLESTPTR